MRRVLRRFDRAFLGVVMGIAAFVIERLVRKSTRRANDVKPEGTPIGVSAADG